ncbi:mucin-2-like [Phlebotomus argentipes]|uniref:mucin-2-like n=1 Tax=Phlebotomus argentipes TaxID=94469 RepID=UPI0028934031|nr:mucin-2-like [Phlebotomus argentipes]
MIAGLVICLLVCLANAAVLTSGVECPEGRWMTTLAHEDCHQFHLCLFGRAVELKCPFGLYWDPIEGGCGRKVDVSCIAVEMRQEDVPQPPVETTTFPPQPDIETTTGAEEETSPEDETSPEEETSPEDGETPTPPFETTGNTPTPPFSTTGGDLTPPVSTTGSQPTPEVSTTGTDVATPPESTTGGETGTPPESTTGGEETATPPESTTPDLPETTTGGTPPPPTPPKCPPTGIHHFPDPTSCYRFFLCQNGELINMMCAPGQIFDQTYLRCRHDGVCALP